MGHNTSQQWKYSKNTREKKEKNTHKRALVWSDSDEKAFEKLYSMSPNRHSKATARKACQELNPDEALWAKIQQGMKRANDYRQTMELRGRWVPKSPSLAKWIAERRWEDNLEAKGPPCEASEAPEEDILPDFGNRENDADSVMADVDNGRHKCPSHDPNGELRSVKQ